MSRALIGSGSTAIATPIKGVEGIMGVVIMLSYLAGGKNLFPPTIEPSLYYSSMKPVGDGMSLETDDQQLSALVDATAIALGRHLKGLTMGSLKVYLSALRNGKRPNGGILPAVSTSYSANDGRLSINSRCFEDDCADGQFSYVPDWVRALAVAQ